MKVSFKINIPCHTVPKMLALLTSVTLCKMLMGEFNNYTHIFLYNGYFKSKVKYS